MKLEEFLNLNKSTAYEVFRYGLKRKILEPLEPNRFKDADIIEIKDNKLFVEFD